VNAAGSSTLAREKDWRVAIHTNVTAVKGNIPGSFESSCGISRLKALSRVKGDGVT
jgi:hypothetical protein